MKAALAVLLIAAASPATAECPDFYRFVDFGIADDDGTLFRGGPLFRAEDFDGVRLLDDSRTICAEVADTLTDGRGNPIPVVRWIAYDTAKTGLNMVLLEARRERDAPKAAETRLVPHQALLAQAGAAQIRGEDHLCVKDGNGLSCQLVSPFGTEAPLIVNCLAGYCRSEVIVLSDTIALGAVWRTQGGSAAEQAEEISATLQGIADFLAPITSGL